MTKHTCVLLGTAVGCFVGYGALDAWCSIDIERHKHPNMPGHVCIDCHTEKQPSRQSQTEALH